MTRHSICEGSKGTSRAATSSLTRSAECRGAVAISKAAGGRVVGPPCSRTWPFAAFITGPPCLLTFLRPDADRTSNVEDGFVTANLALSECGLDLLGHAVLPRSGRALGFPRYSRWQRQTVSPRGRYPRQGGVRPGGGSPRGTPWIHQTSCESGDSVLVFRRTSSRCSVRA